MIYKETIALKKMLEMKKRLRIAQGGTRAGKTIAILLILIDIAQSYNKKIISIVSESVPHLKRGAQRDFLDILKSANYYNDNNWNKTDFIYSFNTGSIIEFFGADQSDKVRGHRRDILFINECNNVSYEIYTQLVIRTKDCIYLDYNPISEFWVNSEILGTSTNYDFSIFTYKDNEFLSEEIIKEIESRKGNKNFWQVYGEGQLGEVEARIYTGWKIIKGIPNEARLIRYGLDFGYTNDPTVIVAVYKFNDWLLLDEIIYLKGIDNSQIARLFKVAQPALIKADSAEPKSIDELRKYGLTILPSQKGAGSVLQGIQYVQQQKIAITERSVNGIKEYRNYLWMTDRNGKMINEPSPIWNHFLDAVRYALDDMRLYQTAKGGAVKIGEPKKTPTQFVQTPQGIQTPDFWTAFRLEQLRRKSTSAIEFHR